MGIVIRKILWDNVYPSRVSTFVGVNSEGFIMFVSVKSKDETSRHGTRDVDFDGMTPFEFLLNTCFYSLVFL